MILDHTVVDQHDFAVAAGVRVRIDVGCGSVRRPAGVPNADRADERLSVERGRNGLHAAGPLANPDSSVPRNGHARAVVAPIFEAMQALEEDVLGRSIADISHDSAHRFRAPSPLMSLTLCGSLAERLPFRRGARR